MAVSTLGQTVKYNLRNRTWRDWSEENQGATRYVWDDVNRMESYATEDDGASYRYRADGMRIQKVEGLTLEWILDEEAKSGYYDENWASNSPTMRYLHDGQMTVEEDFTREVDESIVSDIYKYGIGARGIDWIEKDTYNASPVVAFPIYDGHGNMVATAGRVGSGFQNADPRAYDAWGGVRGGNTTGDPKQRYCANLGHVQDDESGLTYMRARYYEPWTGRFVSEDGKCDGMNWYIYCYNDPILGTDPTGNGFENEAYAWIKYIQTLAVFATLSKIWVGSNLAKPVIAGGLAMLAFWFGIGQGGEEKRSGRDPYSAFLVMLTGAIGICFCDVGAFGPRVRVSAVAEVFNVIGSYSAILSLFLVGNELEDALKG
jgi:RHS repeat-associated protein